MIKLKPIYARFTLMDFANMNLSVPFSIQSLIARTTWKVVTIKLKIVPADTEKPVDSTKLEKALTGKQVAPSSIDILKL